MNVSRILPILLFALCFKIVAAEPPQKPSHPNVIVILTDDQGYGDLSCYGSTDVATPNIDRLAAEGMRMTSFYVASSVCSPSRAALLTGRMPKRVGVPAVLFPRSKTGLPPQEITLAEMVKEKGYQTALIGKWHLGHQKQFMPMNQGFDSFFGIPYSNDMSISKEFDISPEIKFNDGYNHERLNDDVARYLTEYKSVRNKVPLLLGNTVIEYPVDQKTLTRRYTEETVRFIETHKDEPFFIYLAHAMPHVPLFIEEEFANKSNQGIYGDVIQQIDWGVGEIVTALKENGLDTNTLIVYLSDNGPYKRTNGSAGPLRGNKFSTYEGGQRVPGIFWSPGRVKAGAVCDEMVSSLDIFPTVAHYIGATLAEDRVYDGYDIAGLLAGEIHQSPRSDFYFYTANKPLIEGVRKGEWKYLEKGEVAELYNLKSDLGEKKNLISQFPEKAQELQRAMTTFDSQLKK